MNTIISWALHAIPPSAAIAVASISLVGCADSDRNPLAVSDWCWLHYRLAPMGALADDAGPTSIADAAIWGTWLGSTADAPVDRRSPHSTQRRLIDRFIESGAWSRSDREAYQASAHAEPTPATTCETVGARIPVADDGSLPADWEERFLDPNDPAHSELADSAGLER